MKVYQDLVIRGGRLGPQEFIAELERRVTGGWERNLTREQELHSGSPHMHCFSCSERSKRLGADLWMTTRETGELYVCNILGHNRQQITQTQYNTILQDFHKTLVRPAAEGCGAEVLLGNPDPGIEDLLSIHTCKLLRWFSRSANRTSLHPSDRELWHEFVSAAFREKALLDSQMLERWLVEEEKWPEKAASERADEYENGFELLEVFNRPVRPKAKAAGRE